MNANDIKPEDLYVVEGRNLRRVVAVMLRLFEERRMNGDDMRDAAQTLETVVRDSLRVL